MSDSSSASSSGRGRGPGPGPGPLLPPPPAAARQHHWSPQENLDEFWSKFTVKTPGKATRLLPQKNYTAGARRSWSSRKGVGSTQKTQASYEEAAAQCRAKVAQIVKESRRVNQRYRDPHFDLELDLQLGMRDCLDSIDNIKPQPPRRHGLGNRKGGREQQGRQDPASDAAPRGDGGPRSQEPPLRKRRLLGGFEPGFNPMAVHRVVDIFDKPQFYVDGPTANDVRQGRDMGDCWLLAALCTMSNKPGLIERVCVAHDQAVGVYGFVFHRDGEWFSEIIDDKLFLTKPDYDDGYLERILFEDRERGADSEQVYKSIYQSNSGALYFAQCENPNETWLPLLEKAFAKAHNDYESIEGGFTGEALEDLTGGVTSELYTSDILDKEYFWNEELKKVNKDFLFGCSTGIWGRGLGERKGIVELHAYSVMKAVETNGHRLVLLKNPWGKHEWKGPWSDGSKEWTPEWLSRLGHRFGDDGAFWISYEDLLRKYQAFDRTRIFGPEWKVTSLWTTLSVPWMHEYHDTKFAFTMRRAGPVVLVLSQLDDRYYRGLEGQYRFELSFRVHAAGEEEYLVRSQTPYRMNRSVNVELDLEAGEYTVLVKIDADRDTNILPPEEVVRANAKTRREKLARIALSYDLAHSKGQIVETEEEKELRLALEKRSIERSRRRIKKALVEEQKHGYLRACINLLNARREMAKRKKKKEKKKAQEEQKRKSRKKEEEETKAKESIHRDKSNSALTSVDEKATGTENAREQSAKMDGLGGAKNSKNTSFARITWGASTTRAPAAAGKALESKAVAGLEADGNGETQRGGASPTPANKPETGNPEQSEKEAAGDGDIQSQSSPTLETVAAGGSRVAPAPGASSVPVQARDIPLRPQKRTPEAPASPFVPKSPETPDTKEQPAPRQPGTISYTDAGRSATEGSLRDVGTQTAEMPSSGELDLAEQHAHPQFPSPRHHGGPSSNGPYPDPLISVRSSPWQQQEPQQRRGPQIRHNIPNEPPSGRRQHPRKPRHRPGPPLDWHGGSEAGGGGDGSGDEDDESDLSSVSSVSDISDREVELRLEMMRLDGRLPVPSSRRRRPAGGPRNRGMGPRPPLPPQGPPPPMPMPMRPDEAEQESDPWNAVAVVGLRVYYRMGEDEAQDTDVVALRIVRPASLPADDSDSDSEDEDAGTGDRWPWNKKKVKIPDVDDTTRDAVLVAANLEQGGGPEENREGVQAETLTGRDGEIIKNEPDKNQS